MSHRVNFMVCKQSVSNLSVTHIAADYRHAGRDKLFMAGGKIVKNQG